ncbi:MAG TPA: choice-of-anchor tandem repeat NxxGxxAF-containing protein [Thermoanaerobaculia bacterium]|nr:choice-of-anchor tandem repeat NxxGxxAF-containing protein [Thermoanaerobaculia bacterium]
MTRSFGRAFTGLLALALVVAPAYAQEHSFTKVADSTADAFEPFSFGCATINAPGDIAFKAGRLAPDGFNTIPGIYRVNADGSLTTIVEDRKRFVTIGFNPSMNDLGQVSFAARLDGGKKPDTESILRGGGKKLTTIASTADEFNFFGFDTSISNSGEVAFKAELDEELGFEEGLFSGSGRAVTTHYLASTSDFDGNDSRPSINNLGIIGFDESIAFESGIFAGREGTFTTIAAPDPDVFVQKPVLNDAGTTAFYRSFFDEATQQFVEEIATGNGGPLTTVVDTRGEFSFFGFRPPALNGAGEVAFHATLDDFSTSGIFVGPDPVADRVIATGETLDGATVQNLTFCEEGLSDSGQLAFIAQLEDLDSPNGFRMAVFRATPLP